MVLAADSIYMSYNGHDILKGVYIECKLGEIVGVLGLNGSGKSTLFQILFGSLKADQAFIKIDNQNITKAGYESGLIRMLPQESFLPKNISVKSLLKLEGLNDSKDPIIYSITNQQVGNLSAGIIRYLEIFILLYSSIPFIILDEPFVGLSPVFCQKLISLINRVRNKKGIIISDHNYQYIDEIANKLMFLSDGYIQEIDSIKKLSGIYYK